MKITLESILQDKNLVQFCNSKVWVIQIRPCNFSQSRFCLQPPPFDVSVEYPAATE